MKRVSTKREAKLRAANNGYLPFSTISRIGKRKPSLVRIGGREICNLKTREGQTLYRQRIKSMLFRQKGLCCNCKQPLAFEEATFEHEFGRGMGGSKRDDRIEIDGKRVNGASHLLCNHERGSKRTPIWHGKG